MSGLVSLLQESGEGRDVGREVGREEWKVIFSEGRRGVEGATDKADPPPAPTPVSRYSKKASLSGCPSESCPPPPLQSPESGR